MNIDKVELIPVILESKSKLENLMSYYLHDLSEFADDLKISEDGKFKYDGMDLYFSQEDLKPFFIKYDDEYIGFILLNSGKYVPKNIDYMINEFFILKGYRRKGIGSTSIKKLLDSFKGIYLVEQLVDNKLAVNFWKGFYHANQIEFKEKSIVDDGFECIMQRFEVK
ncbi:GNAT family N-acetyltransferase [Oceanirhabdus sp. W0125-5]|uniref:GNAT family N-acetyltransferase n=1 Tax=Oceanirhabdus sp. W0125-5 TaxID=2999116 RepID=UPI0022F2AFF7|nr:GNAT family N-acetyltransferase [Oceanirhabdus sp. W0125-5]WBW97296.1 GNAT family N-acetyltransferase [Oceanirhabdus sp. W0125-5]